MKGRIAVAGSFLALAASVTTILVTQTGASTRGTLARLSNTGRAVPLHGPVAGQAHLTTASLLAVRARHAIYRLDARNGSCFGTGLSTDVGQVGSVQCPHGPFPTPDHPVLDLSIYEGSQRDVREVSLYQAEGVTADGVAAVEFLRPDGTVALRVPVSGNVYATSAVPAGPIASVAAVDKGGKRVWHSP